MSPALGLLVAASLSAPFDASWARSLAPGARAKLPPGTYSGPWRFASGVALDAAGATLIGPAGEDALTAAGDLEIAGLTVRAGLGGKGLVLGRGRVQLTGVTVRGSDRAAVYLAHGGLVMRGGQVFGGEYGVLAEQPRELELESIELMGAQRAGVAVISGPLVLRACRLGGPFLEAAVTLIHGPAALVTNNSIVRAGAMGIKVTNGRAVLRDNRISGARSDTGGREGDGVFAFGSEVELGGDAIADCQGSAVAALGSQVSLDQVTITGPGESGLYVDAHSRLRATATEVGLVAGGLLTEPGGLGPDGGLSFSHAAVPLVALPR